MKYTTLKNDIISILHSSDYNLNLKFYDKDGKTTLTPDDVQWGYINNNNIIIEFMDSKNHVIYIWKDTRNLDDNMKNIIQRIRKLAILNGVSVQIRVYNNLDQRKIYNLIKATMASKKEDEMNESANIINALQNIVSTAKNTKKASDLYLNESLQLYNSESMLKQMISEICSLKTLKSIDLKESLNALLTARTKQDIASIVKSFDNNTLATLNENIDSIHNIAKFVRNQYLNNCPFTHTPNIVEISESVKVYPQKVIDSREQLVKAYNHLVKVSENAKNKIDLLREVKNHKILETYNVKKDDLMNFWLEQNGQIIKPKVVYVFENYNGNKVSINADLSIGVKALSKYLSNGGKPNTTVYDNIISEAQKYADISDFIITYKDNFVARHFIPRFKKIFSETVNKLDSDSFNQELFESSTTVDYKDEYTNLCKEMGFEHPAIKYLAIVETINKAKYLKTLNEQKEKDIQTLVETLKNYVDYPSVIAVQIVDKGLHANLMLTESIEDTRKVASNIYSQISSNPDKLYTSVASGLYGIINSKKLSNQDENFITTLIKYL